MSYSYGFFDNQLIGVDHLNAITERLIGKGVGVAPESISDFNDINQSVVSGGIVPDTVSSLKVTKNEDKVLINPGVAFFDDGTFIEIEDVEELPLISGETNYVYLKSSFSENRAYPVCSLTEPDEKDVLLAIVNKEGNILDKRVYAKGKTVCYGNIDIYNHKARYYITPETIDKYNSATAKIKVYCNPSFYERILFESIGENNNIAIYNVDDGSKISYGTSEQSVHSIAISEKLKVYGYNYYAWEANITKEEDGFLINFNGYKYVGTVQTPQSFYLDITLIAKGRNDL